MCVIDHYLWAHVHYQLRTLLKFGSSTRVNMWGCGEEKRLLLPPHSSAKHERRRCAGTRTADYTECENTQETGVTAFHCVTPCVHNNSGDYASLQAFSWLNNFHSVLIIASFWLTSILKWMEIKMIVANELTQNRGNWNVEIWCWYILYIWAWHSVEEWLVLAAVWAPVQS